MVKLILGAIVGIWLYSNWSSYDTLILLNDLHALYRYLGWE